MINIKGQTAWYNKKAQELEQKRMDLILPIIISGLQEVIIALELVQTAFILTDIAHEALINSLHEKKRLYPLQMNDYHPVTNDIRKFNAILK